MKNFDCLREFSNAFHNLTKLVGKRFDGFTILFHKSGETIHMVRKCLLVKVLVVKPNIVQIINTLLEGRKFFISRHKLRCTLSPCRLQGVSV